MKLSTMIAGSEAAEAACEARLEARRWKLCLCAPPQCQSQGMLVCVPTTRVTAKTVSDKGLK